MISVKDTQKADGTALPLSLNFLFSLRSPRFRPGFYIKLRSEGRIHVPYPEDAPVTIATLILTSFLSVYIPNGFFLLTAVLFSFIFLLIGKFPWPDQDHFGPKPMRSVLPALWSASDTRSYSSGLRYWINARCMAFSCGLFGT